MPDTLYNSDTVRLGATRRWLLHAIWSGLILSGTLWLLLHYVLARQGEFGPERSHLESPLMKLHGALAVLAVWFGGLMWGSHMLKAWQQRRRRLTGAVLLATFLLLIATGYLLYYSTGESLRSAVSATHWIVGVTIPALYGAHRMWQRPRSG